MSASIKQDFVPWNVYERDIQRLSDDIDRLVNKIDGLVDTIGQLTLSQQRDEIAHESAHQSRVRKWGVALAVFSAVLSTASAVTVAVLVRTILGG